MNRREFLAASLAATATYGRGIVPRTHTMDLPKYWIWTGGSPQSSDAELRTKYRKLRERGIQGVFLSQTEPREYDLVREEGLGLHVWMWTTNRGDEWIGKNHPEWYMVSRTGKSCHDQPPYVGYYKWVSPARPEVRAYIRDKALEIAVHPAVQGVHLDYVRYPDVILPKALWKDYKLDQTEEMAEYDFCYSDATCKAFEARYGRDPRKVEAPWADQDWIHFRQETVTTLVREVCEAVRKEGKQISAAVFPTPALARTICRQDWDKWPLDVVAPMIYHSFYEQPVSWIGDAVREDVQAVRFPVVAGLYMPAFAKPEELEQGVRLALKRGARGVSLFGGVSDEMWDAFAKAIG